MMALFLLGCFSAGEGRAQSAFTPEAKGPEAATPAEGVPYVKSRDAHSTVWESVILEPNRWGPPTRRVQRTIELATGLNYRHPETGQWTPSVEEITPYAGGALADRGQHKVFFANNLLVGEGNAAVDCQAPDGTRLRTAIFGLAYLEPATGRQVLLAQVKNCQGEIISKNQVLYGNAFDTLSGAVRYTYTLAGLEQDVLLYELPPPPEDYQMQSDQVVLQVYSEFLPPVAARTRTGILALDDSMRSEDSDVDFGSMKLICGKAFNVGAESAEQSFFPTARQWAVIEGRQFLIEQVSYPELVRHFKALGEAKGASISPPKNNVKRVASRDFKLPARHSAHKANRASMEVARLERPLRGVLIDFKLVESTQSSLRLEANETYKLTGLVNISETLYIEGSSIIKVAASSTAGICVTNVVCETEPYSPAIFTAITDGSLGESLQSGGISGYYGNVALDLSGALCPQVLSNIRFCYMSNAVAGADVTLKHAQLIKCKNGFASGSTGSVLKNVLAWNLDRIANISGGTVRAEHLTAHNCTNLMANTTGAAYLTNCLFAGSGGWQCATLHTNASVFLTSDTGVFQVAGSGSHYLAASSSYRGIGTTVIDPALLADMRAKTTYPPVIYSNAVISADTNFFACAPRQSPSLDLGFGYDPLDYAFGGTTANANITFRAGAVAGWFRTSSGWQSAGHGLTLGDLQILTFAGEPDLPVYWARCNLVQEGCNGLWGYGYGPGSITGRAYPDFANAPVVNARFAKFPMLHYEGNVFRDDSGYLIVRANDCGFRAGSSGGYASAFAFTNCLFERFYFGTDWHTTASDQCDVAFVNCTFNGGTVDLRRTHSECGICGLSTCFGLDCGNSCCLAPCYCSECGHTCCDCEGPCDCQACSYNHSAQCDCGTASPAMVRWIIKDCAFDRTAFNFSDYANGDSSVTDFSNNAFITGQTVTTPQGSDNVVVQDFNWQAGSFGKYYLPTDSPLINEGYTAAGILGMAQYTSQVNNSAEGTSMVDIGRLYIAANAGGQPLDIDGDGIPNYIEDANGNNSADQWVETDFRNPDTDGDGLPDSVDYDPWNFDHSDLVFTITSPLENAVIP